MLRCGKGNHVPGGRFRVSESRKTSGNLMRLPWLKWVTGVCAAIWLMGGILFRNSESVLGLPPRTLFVKIFGSITLVLATYMFLLWWGKREPKKPKK
jgi:hypothetical protein